MHCDNKVKENFKKICRSFRVADLFIFVFFIALGVWLIARPKKTNTKYVTILAEGRELVYPLDVDAIYEIEGRIGTSKIQVEGGKVRFIYSPCPNQTCVALGWGTTLVCLPNDIIIQVDGEDLDNVAY